jgi:hypothetical protein
MAAAGAPGLGRACAEVTQPHGPPLVDLGQLHKYLSDRHTVDAVYLALIQRAWMEPRRWAPPPGKLQLRMRPLQRRAASGRPPHPPTRAPAPQRGRGGQGHRGLPAEPAQVRLPPGGGGGG